MASPAVAIPNSAPEPLHDNDVDMIDAAQSTTKRKREHDDHDQQIGNHPATNGSSPKQPSEHDTASVRDFLLVLERYDANPSILKRPLLERDATAGSNGEPNTKRQKSEDGSPLPSIADKAAKNEYSDLVALVTDIKAAVRDQLAELRATGLRGGMEATEDAIGKTMAFNQKTLELSGRELSYPRQVRSIDPASDLQSTARGNMVLSVYGEAPRARQLYSSLQQPVATAEKPDGTIKPIREDCLPSGIRTAKVTPFTFPSAVEKDKKGKTLGDLFPAPRDLPGLQPPKASKSTTKGVQVGWHHPELTEKSKYRQNSYFSQNISTGQWLNYSNAAPPSRTMTKQRERALSLAGTKPSSSDLEMTEMDALFRGAFSSFAPTKDDSAAMISSGALSRTMWWQKIGKRSFDRLIEVELSDENSEDVDMEKEPEVQVDEKLIGQALDNWDNLNIDPSLEKACCPKKPDEEKDVDDILQEISDMIQTLISHHKNRNLVLPSAVGSSRYTTDPSHRDMLTNGTPAQPSEEETATYEVLKAQLILIIQTLPPFAVARLNSDQLEELNISTKLEIRGDEYQGVMEDDEATARAKAASAAVSTPRPVTQRSTSSSSNLQYGGQYQGVNRASISSGQYYGTQTPARPPSAIQRPPPMPQPPYSAQRPPSNAGYRPPSGYHNPNTGYTQLAKTQQAFSQSPYTATPPYSRPSYQGQPAAPYHNHMANATPQARHATHTPASQPQPTYHQHTYPQQHHQGGAGSHPPYNPYTNGATAVSQRTHSPQVSHQQPTTHYIPQQAYNPNATPSRQPPYGGQQAMANAQQHQQPQQQRFYPPGSAPQAPQSTPNPQGSPQGLGYHTSLNPMQVQQAMDQAKARFNAQSKVPKPNEGMRNPAQGQGQQIGAPVGLGGIGLGADQSRLAAARNSVQAGINYSTPSPAPATPRPQGSSPAMPNGVPLGPTPGQSQTPGQNGELERQQA